MLKLNSRTLSRPEGVYGLDQRIRNVITGRVYKIS